MQWGYDVACEEPFSQYFITGAEMWEKHDGKLPTGKKLIDDRIADNMFQQLLLRSDEYDMIVAPNLNGDYISDAAAACVGGLGMAPGANVGDFLAVFEATHGTAPKYAGQNKINPTSLILSGAMALDYLGWGEASEQVFKSVENTLSK